MLQLLYYGVKCYHRIKHAVKTWLKREDDIVEYQERDEVWQAAQAGNRHCVVKGGQEEKGKALMGQCANCTSKKSCSTAGCLFERIKMAAGNASDYIMGDKKSPAQMRSEIKASSGQTKMGKTLGWKGFK